MVCGQVSQTEISKFPQNVESLTDSGSVLQCWHSEFPRGSEEQKAYQQIDQKGRCVSFWETRAIHPSPQRYSPKKKKKKVSSLEKAYQHAEMPWALRIIWSRFILNIKRNLLNNGSALLPRLRGEKSASVQPKKRSRLNSRETMNVEKDAQLCAGWWKYRWGLCSTACGHVIYYEEQIKWESKKSSC